MMLCSENRSTNNLSRNVPSLLQELFDVRSLKYNVPKEANCLCKAKRDWSRPLSSFMVLSMWLALRELPTHTPWKNTSNMMRL